MLRAKNVNMPQGKTQRTNYTLSCFLFDRDKIRKEVNYLAQTFARLPYPLRFHTADIGQSVHEDLSFITILRNQNAGHSRYL
jgi:hypothetical protein